MQVQRLGKIIGQRLARSRWVFLRKPDCRTVIALQGELRRGSESFCNGSHKRSEFRVLEKEWNKREAQARSVALCQSCNQARGLLVKGCSLLMAAQNKVDIQRPQSIYELIAGDVYGSTAHI